MILNRLLKIMFCTWGVQTSQDPKTISIPEKRDGKNIHQKKYGKFHKNISYNIPWIMSKCIIKNHAITLKNATKHKEYKIPLQIVCTLKLVVYKIKSIFTIINLIFYTLIKFNIITFNNSNLSIKMTHFKWHIQMTQNDLCRLSTISFTFQLNILLYRDYNFIICGTVNVEPNDLSPNSTSIQRKSHLVQ